MILIKRKLKETEENHKRNKEGQVSKFLKNFGTAVNHIIVEILGDLNVFSLHVHGIYIVYFDFLKKGDE
jgi:hypothetical protein